MIKASKLVRRSAGVLLPIVAAAVTAACGSASSASPTAVTTAPPTPVTTGAPSPPAPSGGVKMTSPDGFIYNVSLDPSGIRTATSFTTDDGSGSGGTAVDVPPGDTLVVAKLILANQTDRQEPLAMAPIGPLPAANSASQLVLAVPQAQASAFGILPQNQQTECGTPPAPLAAPPGYCTLRAGVGAFSPAQQDITRPPQLAPGTSGTLTLITYGALASHIPQSAPVSAVKVYVQTTTNCPDSSGCWTVLG